MLYTKCVTIRDAQIKEKQSISSERAEEEARLDMAMEMERLKALKMYDEREQKRIENRRKGAAVIRAQIEERVQESLRRLELKQQEQVCVFPFPLCSYFGATLGAVSQLFTTFHNNFALYHQ